MNLKSLSFISLAFFSLSMVFTSCEDDNGEDVGSSVQPEGDQLHTSSNMVSVATHSVISDSVLSKADYLYLGQYTDSHFGVTQAEFMTQVDARLDGISLPDTTVSTSSTQSGIYYTLLSDIDASYGNITKVTNPTDMVVDSVFFYICYENDFMGDSTALQAINVYALNNTLPTNKKLYTNIKVSDYCDKDTLLGSLAYQVKNKRVLKVPISVDYGKRLAAAYVKGSHLSYQSQFNKLFKGFYVSNSFNEGAIIKVSVAGIQLFYHFNGMIHTTHNGNDTIVDSRSLSANPLVSSLFLSANKSVERVNIINHPDDSQMAALTTSTQNSYAFTPSGLYTAVDIPYSTIHDSVLSHTNKDTASLSKVMFNSARLKLYSQNIDWSTKLSKTPNSYMLLINKDSIADFFYSNQKPDAIHSISAVYDTSCTCYSFDISRAVQVRMNTGDTSLLKNMVVVPIYLSKSDDIYYYYQQLWVTGTRFYGPDAAEVSKRPRVDLVYTRRE